MKNKANFAEVSRWVHFNTWLVWRELTMCNEYSLAPVVSRFMPSSNAVPASPCDVLAMTEELASVMWLLDEEHECLAERVAELEGPRTPLELPAPIESVLSAPQTPRAGIQVVRASIAARAALIESHMDKVDAHTRLVFRKHLTILAALVQPPLEAVSAELDAGEPSEAGDSDLPTSIGELSEHYREFLPGRARPHSDSFLNISLLSTRG